jgi:sodium transport system permease protein
VTWAAVLTQLGVILAPTLAMTFVCVSSPRQTLLLRWPRVAALPAAVLLAVALHPAVIAVQSYLQQSYPAGDKMRAALQRLQDIIGQAPLWQLLLLLAVLPAVCEELAFRGFILSGFRRLGRKWQAIVFSSLIFGFAHGVLQQSLIASLLGLLLGYLAIHSGSILPGILFHAVHNALAVSVGQVTAEMIEDWPLFEALLQPSGAGYTYRWGVVALGAVGAVALLSWFGRQPYERTPEELLQEAISHGGEEE